MTTESKSQLSGGVQARRAKAEALVANNKVHPVYGRPREYAVEGTGGVMYLVGGASCVCPDSANRHALRGQCKHWLAVSIFSQQEAAVKSSKTAQPASPERSLEDLIKDLY